MISHEQDLMAQVGLIERLELPEQARVLEAGCGTGPHLRQLAQVRPKWRLTGVDLCCAALSSGCMMAALQKSGIDFLQLDLYKLPYADGSFDFVYTRDVLDHLTDPEQALHELRRVLAPGGTLLLFEQREPSA
ncbi:hypothetical protein CIG75_00525 [Tumebacillus algifaecis]|uniref:Methyltransferase type 11 domain-containing protein n=1 Tax=Tumebacillus algifaecis TaxID=1214604 RepID=A0A223CWA1_9BACL|nr:class I SAM-dependent methyltransferase [Tumebacillus algifaecis]ASS73608.1 hypothetical protein CIG75_00525 [Tumebacillus algifaecis]